MSPSLKPTHNLGHYTMAVSEYDKNGNIRNLERMGAINDSGKMGMMDQLVYSYAGNQLLGIAEGASNSKGFTSKTSVATQYDYDVNGNMVQDLNKGISAINYNHLNLPERIAINGSNINYQYDASGVKLKKQVNGQTTEYSGSTVYKNDKLEFIHMPEGYIEPTDNGYRYVYRLTDHLGNTRVSFFKNTVTKEVDVLDTNDYYPFGLEHQKAENTASSSNIGQQFKFNGVELNDDLGLYEMDFRFYDPAAPHFAMIDPLAEERYSVSPYNFAQNNPISRVDPTGLLDTYGLDKKGNITWLDDQKYCDENGNEVDRLYATSENGGLEAENYVEVSDKSLLVSLSNKGQIELGGKTRDLSHGFTDNNEDAYNVFTFAANNSNVEWGLNRFENTSGDGSQSNFVGTYHDDDLSPRPSRVFNGFDNLTTTIFNVHSHPNINFNESDWGDGARIFNGIVIPGTAGDYVNLRNNKYGGGNFYIYYPNWNGLYQYTKEQARIKVSSRQIQ
ncbi:hypothetical protein N9H57_01465 [Flavobacteriaceae bacterium]|nr:hypothetical protein [Flavobacteriaceae bacterium]